MIQIINIRINLEFIFVIYVYSYRWVFLNKRADIRAEHFFGLFYREILREINGDGGF